MGRLTGETLDGETACYSYDHAGNRLTRTGAGRTEHYRYNSRNQLTELDSTAGTVRYEYDPAGSLTAGVHTAQGGSAAERTGYTYDAYNRNTSVCGAGYVQQNHYDAEGLRYAVTGNGETTNFVYRNDMPVSELDADKNPLRGYVLGNEYISQVDGTSFGYYLNDEQGSVRYLTGSDGSIRNHYRYSAFGETITAEETVPNRLRYNEQMADGLIGLYYLRARYYNASLGRFTQEDVIYNDGLNLYAYCNSNPVMYSDPSGFEAENGLTCTHKVGGEKDSKGGKYATDFDDLAAYRRQQGMPIAGSAEDKHTAAKLIIGDNVYYGRNGHGKQNKVTSVFTVNPQTATHAEGDVFYQAKMAGNTNTTAVLITDRCACRACGFNGGIRSLAKQMGITDLTIVSPSHDPINFNPQVKPIPNPFK